MDMQNFTPDDGIAVLMAQIMALSFIAKDEMNVQQITKLASVALLTAVDSDRDRYLRIVNKSQQFGAEFGPIWLGLENAG